MENFLTSPNCSWKEKQHHCDSPEWHSPKWFDCVRQHLSTASDIVYQEKSRKLCISQFQTPTFPPSPPPGDPRGFALYCSPGPGFILDDLPRGPGFCISIKLHLQSVSWSLAEFRHNKIVQSPHENYFNVCRQHKEKWDLVKMTIIQTGW